MSAISGGVVSIEDGLKKSEEYAPARKVRVELRFDVPNGGDPEDCLSKTAAMAQAWLLRLLNPDATAAVLEKKKAPGRPPAPPKDTGKPPHDAKASEAASKVEQAAAAGQVADPLGDILGKDAAEQPKAKEYTDAELMSEVGKANGRTKNPPRIKEIAVKYAPQISKIPAEQREAFVKELAAIPDAPKE